MERRYRSKWGRWILESLVIAVVVVSMLILFARLLAFVGSLGWIVLLIVCILLILILLFFLMTYIRRRYRYL